MAQVEGKVYRVNLIRHVAALLRQCASVSGPLCMTCPDLVLDAALLLWSPFATAMLDTIAGRQVSEPLHPTLVDVAVEALSAVHAVLYECQTQDFCLRATVSLRLGHLVLSERQDYRLAIQVLRSSLRSISCHRGMLLAGKEGALSFSVCPERLRSFGLESSHELMTLAALEAETLALMFRAELEMSASDRNSIALASQEIEREESDSDPVAVLGGQRAASARSFKSSKKDASSDNDEGGSLRRPSKAIEQRLLAECRRNRYSKAILMATICSLRSPDDYEEKASLIERATHLLLEADSEEEALLSKAIHAQQPSLTERTGGHEQGVLPAPVVIRQTGSEITLKIVPFKEEAELKQTQRSSSPRSPRNASKTFRVAYYILYGKAAGSGTEVSVQNTDLVGTGIRIPVRDAAKDDEVVVNIRGLAPNEAYVFAAASYFEDGRIAGPGIGKTCTAVTNASPLPLLVCWSMLSKLGHSSVAHIIDESASRAFAALHHSVKDKVRSLRDRVVQATNTIIEFFVVTRQSEELWRSNPADDAALRSGRLLRASPAGVQSFVHATLLRNLLSEKRETSQVTPSFATLASSEFNAPAYLDQVSILRSAQSLSLALEAACMLRDDILVLRVACECYRQLVPLLLQTRAPQPRVMRLVVTLQQAFRHVSRTSWTDAAMATYARCCYEVLRAGTQLGEPDFARAAVLGQAFAECDALEDLVERSKVPDGEGGQGASDKDGGSGMSPSVALQRILLVQFGASRKKPEEAASAIHRAISADAPIPKSSEEDLLLLELARASRPEQPGAVSSLKSVWANLCSARAEKEYSAALPRLWALTCKIALAFPSCDAGCWATDAQSLLWDLEETSPAYPSAFVRDVLREEETENEDPSQAVAARAFPFSTDRDPLQLAAAHEYFEGERRRQREEADLLQAKTQATTDCDPETGNLQAAEEAGEEQDDSAEAENAREAARKAEARRVAALTVAARRARLLAAGAQKPSLADAQHLSALAELELVRATAAFTKWSEVDYSAFADEYPCFADGVLQEGPSTDLKWKAVASESKDGPDEAAAAVPPLLIKHSLNKISEAQAAPRRWNPPESSASIERFAIALQSTPEIIHLCARGLVRARWAHAWQQVTLFINMLWNALQFAQAAPWQFVEDAVNEKTLVPALLARIESARHGEQRAAAQAATSHNETSSSHASNTAVDVKLSASEMRYDWRPIFRAACATLDMLEQIQQQTTTQGLGTAAGAQALAAEKIDLVAAARLVSFCVQCLCNTKRWAEVVNVGSRLTYALGSHDKLVSPTLPLVILAQRKLLTAADGEVCLAESRLNDAQSEWEDQQTKLRLKQAKRKQRGSVSRQGGASEAVSDAELAYRTMERQLQEDLRGKRARSDALREVLQSLEQVSEEISRDKSLILEALEKARALRKVCLLEKIAPETIGLESLVASTVPGAATKRSRATTQTHKTTPSKSTSASSVYSSSKASSSTLRKSLTNHHAEEKAEDPDAADGLRGYSLRAATAAYNSAIGAMRAKQEENATLALALGELGDLHAASGGKEGWRQARICWKESIDAVLQSMDSAKSWRQLLTKRVLGSAAQIAGVGNKQVGRTPELAAQQALLLSVGLQSCLVGAVSAGRLMCFSASGSCRDRLEFSRLAAELLSAVFCGLPHPTRYVEFALHQAPELFPTGGADSSVLYGSVGVERFLPLATCAAENLARSPVNGDKLRALPVLALTEYLSRHVICSPSKAAAACLARVGVLASLGLLREALELLFEVVSGKRFGFSQPYVVSRSCLEASRTERSLSSPRPSQAAAGGGLSPRVVEDSHHSAAFASRLQEQYRMAKAFDGSKQPWSEQNIAALAFLFREAADPRQESGAKKESNSKTPAATPKGAAKGKGDKAGVAPAAPAVQDAQRASGDDLKETASDPLPFIRVLLGQDVDREAVLRKCQIACKALEHWPESNQAAESVAHMRSSIADQALASLEIVSKQVFAEERKTALQARLAAAEAEKEEEEEEGEDEEKSNRKSGRLLNTGKQQAQVLDSQLSIRGAPLRFLQDAALLRAKLRIVLGDVKGALESLRSDINSLVCPKEEVRCDQAPTDGTQGLGIAWLFECRALAVQCLLRLQRFSEAEVEAKLFVASCAPADEWAWRRRALALQAQAQLALGRLDGAAGAVEEGLDEREQAPDALEDCSGRAQLLVLKAVVTRERARLPGAGEGHAEECSSLREAVRCLEEECRSLGLHEPERMPARVHSSVYLDSLCPLLFARLRLAESSQSASESSEIELIIRQGLRESAGLPDAVQHLRARLWLLLGSVTRRPDALASGLGLLLEAGGTSLDLEELRLAAVRIAALLPPQRAADKAGWLLVGSRVADAHFALVNSFQAVAESAPPNLAKAEEELQHRATVLSPLVARAFEHVHGLSELLQAFVNHTQQSQHVLDLPRRLQIQQLERYLTDSLPSFASLCRGDRAIPTDALVAATERRGQDEEPYALNSSSKEELPDTTVVVQWLPCGERTVDCHVALHGLSRSEDQVTACFEFRGIPRSKVLAVQRTFARLRLKEEGGAADEHGFQAALRDAASLLRPGADCGSLSVSDPTYFEAVFDVKRGSAISENPQVFSWWETLVSL